MKVNFDITKIVFTPSCDNYDFTLGITRDYKGNKCYLGIDIPCKDDAEWRFWLLYEDDNDAWNISNEDKEYVKQKAMDIHTMENILKRDNETMIYCGKRGILWIN